MSVEATHSSRRSELMAAIYAFKGELFVVAVLSLVANVLMLAPTLYMLQVFDRVLISQSELTLLALSAIALFLYVVMALAEWMRSRVLVLAGVRLDDKLSTKVFVASFGAGLKESHARPERAMHDLSELRQFLTGVGVFAFFDVPWVPIYIGVLFVLHHWLGATAAAFAVIQVALAWWAHKQTAILTEAAQKSSVEDLSYVQSKLRNAETLEAMGMVQNLALHWRVRHYAYLSQSNKAQGALHRVTAVSKFARYTQQSLVLGMGALLVIDGQITPGAMIAANLLTARALAPIDMLVSVWRSLVSARSAFLRLVSLLRDFPPRPRVLMTPLAPNASVRLVDVVAKAPGRIDPILKHVSLEALPGTLTVVVGASGSGKSTLARVIVGIWPDLTGDVFLGETQVNSWDRGELGPHIGYLPQDVELFDGTIAENIARFNPLESYKVIEAAESTGLHEMILRFPKGYDTPIGEAGSLLSGGQRQRIALARAVYGKPSLVVLDEPNSNLDEAGEVALMKTVINLKMEGKIVVLITHRTAAMTATDRLVVMEDGRIKFAGFRDTVIQALQQAHKTSGLQNAETA